MEFDPKVIVGGFASILAVIILGWLFIFKILPLLQSLS